MRNQEANYKNNQKRQMMDFQNLMIWKWRYKYRRYEILTLVQNLSSDIGSGKQDIVGYC